MVSIKTFSVRQISEKIGRNEGFLLFSTKKRGMNKEKVGEEIRNFDQNIDPDVISSSASLC